MSRSTHAKRIAARFERREATLAIETGLHEWADQDHLDSPLDDQNDPLQAESDALLDSLSEEDGLDFDLELDEPYYWLIGSFSNSTMVQSPYRWDDDWADEYYSLPDDAEDFWPSNVL